MLFTDSDLISTYDLLSIDEEVNDVAKVSKTNVFGPQSAIRQAWMECSSTLNSQLQMYTAYFGTAGSVNLYAAVFNTGVYSMKQPRIMQNRIIAHNWRYDGAMSPCQNWIAYTALAILYRNASNRKLEDRYEKKAVRFEQKAIDSWALWKNQGLPTSLGPLEAPAALHAHQTGSWTASAVSGTSATVKQYVVAITYYDSAAYVSQTNKQNAESGPSAYQSVNTLGSQVLHFDITGLNPPTGSQDKIGISEGLTFSRPATNWNVYVGIAPSDGSIPVLYYQASNPIATKTYTLPADPVLSGTILDMGQFPDPGSNIVFDGRMINRM